MKTLFHGIVAGLLVVPLLSFAEPAKVIKNDKLRAKPFTDAMVVQTLQAGQAVDIQQRQGSWYFIKIAGKTGWAPMLSIRRSQQAAVASAGSLSQTATGRSSGSGIVSTTGVRGLNEEDLKTAAYSENAVASAEKHRVARDSAIAFSAAGALAAQKVPPLSTSPATGGAQ
jgi:uncharacterized protein YgiM (DUF1202 family)